MIPEIGHFLTVLAFVFALVQFLPPLWGAYRGDALLMRYASIGALGQFAALSLAFAALTHAYVTSDFSVFNVATNSASQKPMIYKISGTWGNHEGSMLLWVLILALFAAAVALFGDNLPPRFKARVLAVQGSISAAFLAFILFTSNPFIRLDPAPFEGSGLNPILQDPGLALHPPLLYIGYVGFSMTFSFAVAALIEGRVDPAWARWVRPWTLAAWTSLSLGIALGSWWAYYELGWGGWWFWDPVENASFMPWLIGTALLHSAIVVEKRDSLKSWTILLAILTFGFSLLGTFLVRSGVITSVHAFATDPTRGVFILLILAFFLGGALILYAWRAPSLQSGATFAPISREGGLVLNNLLLATGTATVFLGTLYPLFLEAVGGAKISVGPPFFEATFVPLMMPLLVAVPIGSMLAWKRGDLEGVMKRLLFAGAVALGAALAIGLWFDPRNVGAAIGVGLAAWLVLGAMSDLVYRAGFGRVALSRAFSRLIGLPRSAFGSALAHAGLGLAVLGMTASSAWRQEVITVLPVGGSTEIAGYEVTLSSVEEVQGPNWVSERANFSVTHGGGFATELWSERRFFAVERQNTTEAGIDSGLMRDLYFVLGESAAEGRTVRLYHNPLVFWIWGGVGVMTIAGLLSLSDRRHRVGAPKPAARRTAPPASAAAEGAAS